MTLKGRQFGWLVIGGLTALWCIGVYLRVEALFSADCLYNRFARLVPGLLPSIFWALSATLLILWGGLGWILYREKRAPLPLLKPAELMNLTSLQFERYVALLFRRKGFRVQHRGGSGDHGVDLEVLTSSNQLGIVQCKRYRATVGEQVVRDLYGTMLHEGAAHAYLVTTGGISSSARTWADGKPLTLVDGNRLFELVRSLQR